MIDRIHEFIAFKLKADMVGSQRKRDSLPAIRKGRDEDSLEIKRGILMDLLRRLGK